jgi:hypothetical protein
MALVTVALRADVHTESRRMVGDRTGMATAVHQAATIRTDLATGDRAHTHQVKAHQTSTGVRLGTMASPAKRLTGLTVFTAHQRRQNFPVSTIRCPLRMHCAY